MINQRRLVRSSLVLTLLLGMAGASTASWTDDPEKADTFPPAVRASQVSLVLERKGKRTQFQATVVAKSENVVTLLTAAHCVAAADEGGPILLRRGENSADGWIETVKGNPHYRAAPSGDIPGADNAVFQVKLTPDSKFIETLRPIDISTSAIPDPSGKIVMVGTLDQFGKEHVVKAGNFTNPRWLEWGPSYKPAAGDSGGGVFVVRTATDGTPIPLLIGVVVDRSAQGGGASLLNHRDRWLDAALAAPDPKK